MGSGNFLDELRQRKVVRATVVYVAALFAVLEFAEIITKIIDKKLRRETGGERTFG